MRVQPGESSSSGLELRDADRIGVVQDLTLQIRELHHVVIDDPDAADSGGSQVERRRRSEPARAHEQHARCSQPSLSLEPDFGDADVAAVAGQLFSCQIRRHVTSGSNVYGERVAERGEVGRDPRWPTKHR